MGRRPMLTPDVIEAIKFEFNTNRKTIAELAIASNLSQGSISNALHGYRRKKTLQGVSNTLDTTLLNTVLARLDTLDERLSTLIQQQTLRFNTVDSKVNTVKRTVDTLDTMISNRLDR